jgi:hypothetical protein
MGEGHLLVGLLLVGLRLQIQINKEGMQQDSTSLAAKDRTVRYKVRYGRAGLEGQGVRPPRAPEIKGPPISSWLLRHNSGERANLTTPFEQARAFLVGFNWLGPVDLTKKKG